uniref:Uncharacterized protein n=1 Tax=Chromera velia CCMP2878 TaxID=1169474 RepID=A0A0G4HAQ3_9ALVE|mmetsp:Transcript_24579/g.48239  ORF Transcript_24579/g.48239 Transcript_24579/m.48239 type:complete len:245 (+) Transcript_24579:117-851(+)|eukprot:Cvel_25591.t1-p1 / transcript=Cvel_25591.t1 / gene=Cvel_25591 / organism=Chromera_velia_CCMP2878 / gene_product=hypothetical protein / transcript_product=hypothetical protein / location=Cvel_scaffold2920:3775-4506(-) / protein_length=244 / sequence_SO=supercontig / SO=protein_coding / is_pseudo=false
MARGDTQNKKPAARLSCRGKMAWIAQLIIPVGCIAAFIILIMTHTSFSDECTFEQKWLVEFLIAVPPILLFLVSTIMFLAFFFAREKKGPIFCTLAVFMPVVIACAIWAGVMAGAMMYWDRPEMLQSEYNPYPNIPENCPTSFAEQLSWSALTSLATALLAVFFGFFNCLLFQVCCERQSKKQQEKIAPSQKSDIENQKEKEVPKKDSATETEKVSTNPFNQQTEPQEHQEESRRTADATLGDF